MHRPALSDSLFAPPRWCWRQAGDIGWWVRSDWQDALLGPVGLRLEDWRREGLVSVVKTGSQRVVYRVELPQGTVFVKHFLVPGLGAKLRQWFRRGKGRNEGRRTRYLAAIGVPTITPIALGEQRKRFFLFENYLITTAIADTTPLNQFVERTLPGWPAERQARVRQRLARALGLLTARLHNSGVVHQDFHPGNILVRMGHDDRPSLAMVDLDALRQSFPLGWPEAEHNLALLNHYFWLRSNRSDRYRFLRAYLAARQAGPTSPELERFAQNIENATRAWAERLWCRWGRRCRSSNKYFHVQKGRCVWSIASRDLEPALVRALVADPDAPFGWPGTVVLKSSRTTTVAEVTLPVAGTPARVIYKRFNLRRWFEPFLTYFRPTHAWRSWQAGQHLVSRAIPTPQNLAYIARRRPFGKSLFWYLPHETYLITRKEEPAITLASYIHRFLPTLDLAEQRLCVRGLSTALARLLRVLHERSLSNRDLKSANLLLVGEPDSAEPRLSMIDLEGVTLYHPLPEHRRIQNLARLNVSLADVPGRTRTDALRFLRAYLPWGLSPRNDWKGLWRAVAARSQVKESQSHRRGRQLS
jgi:tRNA A-37 threonylcarbamoyl transferase component Bud32